MFLFIYTEWDEYNRDATQYRDKRLPIDGAAVSERALEL